MCLVEYAKADTEDILIKITVANRGPEAANLRVLPTVWFRNTWSWGNARRRPELHESHPAPDPVIELEPQSSRQSLAALRRFAGTIVHGKRDQRPAPVRNEESHSLRKRRDQ